MIKAMQWGARAVAVALLGWGLALPPSVGEAHAAPTIRAAERAKNAKPAQAYKRPQAKKRVSAQQRRSVKVSAKQRRALKAKAGAVKAPVAAAERTRVASVAWAPQPRVPTMLDGARASAPAESTAFDALDDGGVLDPARLRSNAVLVLDGDTNTVLIGKNDDAVLPIASLTKLMTGLVIADAGLPMDEVLTITEDDVDRIKGSGSRLAVGTRLTRAEALHLALMSSENRAAHALGRTYPGGLPAFVEAMNRKAMELGMRATRFVEPTGLSSDNRSTPRDLARLAAAAAQRPMLRELSVSPEYELATGRRVVHYRNSNKLVRESDWDILLQKTGYIREAGRCVVMQVRLAGRNLILVLMNAANSSARWADAEHLLRWLERSLPQARAGV